MKYRDVVSFELIDDIIQLRESTDQAIARRHVRTYVISKRMADSLIHVVIPQIQFNRRANNKGVLIVGNYGSGKSHLLSVLAAVAEFAELADDIRHPEVAEAMREAIAGRFKVLRVEVGGVTAPLRDILLGELERALASWGVHYHFPPANALTNHKDVLAEAVAALRQRYPDHGVLLVVDEMLDYLRSRDERELILDLSFLRELGEVAELTPLRFVAGLQETLFDNPRFAFVSEQLRRVKDRFEQVRITREDIAYVVAERLLRKTDAQLARIRDYLARFNPLYPALAERLDEFARMFPVHPAYVEVVEGMQIVEKRQILKTLSEAMRGLLDEPVPDEQPGLISFDHYWTALRDNPAVRTLPEVREVVDKSEVLERRVKQSFTRKHLLALALRLIHALSAYRLTTNDIYAPIGLTAEELRDKLMPGVPGLPEPSADLLLDQVRVALREIMRTVSGQYLSENKENGQYYIDVKKDIDFEACIQERGDFLSEGDLNRYFFDALRQVLALSETTYVTGARIWAYELPWTERGVTRPGYLFFGAPDERTTAQPPRDFYVYFLPPFDARPWHDEKLADEVIFKLAGADENFRAILRRYAGAVALAADSPNYRRIYQDKADEALSKRLIPWLKANLLERVQVIHQGRAQSVREVLPELSTTASEDVRDLLDRIAARILAVTFDDRYPDYPALTEAQRPITEDNRAVAASEALRGLSGKPTRLGRAVLRGLKLLDDADRLQPRRSPYATHFLDVLHSRPAPQVVRRGDILQKVAESVGGPIYKDARFKLEPEWVVVVLAALVYSGDIVITLPNNKLVDANTLESFVLNGLGELLDFAHYGRPRDLPLSQWCDLFGALNLSPGLIRNEATREEALRALQTAVQQRSSETADLENQLQALTLWNEPLFSDRLTFAVGADHIVEARSPIGMTSAMDLKAAVRGYRQALGKLSAINTVGKLSQLDVDPQEFARNQDLVQRAQNLVQATNQFAPQVSYLAQAQAYLPAGHPWQAEAARLRQHILETLRCFACDKATLTDLSALERKLGMLKKTYIEAYAAEHRRLRLNAEGEARRQKLLNDPRLKALQALRHVDLLRANESQLADLERQLSELCACKEFHEGVLADSPICPYCKLNPAVGNRLPSAEERLSALDDRLSALGESWQRTLREALRSDQAQASLSAMTAAERQPIERFLAQAEADWALPEGLVEQANQALRGIRIVPVSRDALLQALGEGGLPCTPDALRQRFKRFLDDLLRGKDEGSTRLTLGE